MSLTPPVPVIKTNSFFTSNDLKTKFLYGIPLTNPKGELLNDTAIQFHCDAAVDWLERELQIDIKERLYTEERHDFKWEEYLNWGFLRLYHQPITEITELKVEYPDTGQSVVYPLTWVQIEMEGISGCINIVPGTGSATSFIIGQGSTLLPLIFKTQSYLPHLFKLSYKSGFKANAVPMSLLSLIGKKAAIDILTLVGDQIITPGVQSSSISLDGVSESVSSMLGAFRARIDQYTADIQREMLSAKDYWHGIKMTVA